jgi:hypothetical protein
MLNRISKLEDIYTQNNSLTIDLSEDESLDDQ